jgi:hypothetical protein
MTTLDLEGKALQVMAAKCTDTHLHVTLKHGQTISTPLWWYPRLLAASAEQRTNYEIMPLGIHWPEIDEDLSIEGMLKGAKAPGAKPPKQA